VQKFHNNDVLVRVFATKGGFTTQEWWINEASEGRRMVFDSYNEAVLAARQWQTDLKAYGLQVTTDQHVKNALKESKNPTQWTSRTIKPKKTEEEIYADMTAGKKMYGTLIW
tara:strand:- start:904 stop:1239 length:336 start_codon:yes stop_codon:yes gene_type:complete